MNRLSMMFVSAINHAIHQLIFTNLHRFLCPMPPIHPFTCTHNIPTVHIPQCDAEGCGAEFKKKNQLKKHEVSHTGIMPFPCKTEGCGKGFMLQSQLRTHSKRHTTVYTCDAEGCTRTFDKWSLLVTHRKSHRTLVCQKCNKIFLRPEGVSTAKGRGN